MCGIFGVAGIENAAQLTYLGLYALQHRGQESAGIVTIDGAATAHSHRGMGLVQDVFPAAVLDRLGGDIAIGHTRYSTSGTSAITNAQPMVVNYHAGPLAIAHNGNLIMLGRCETTLSARDPSSSRPRTPRRSCT